ncbi:hypothetical protein FRB94_005908 [Tulasnella sp. JGI-2019a]|nr:hypothetical protein FRB93_006154 [Tulasnella sp. JGI-2019a]KAG8999820.1 hypothetical protein FRB94_005908 [Tulasnella sp. JGI-2019a]KAG9029068.1 hypothetical protein FRB95_005763 [Tulasnella sp. JGI-2019a]
MVDVPFNELTEQPSYIRLNFEYDPNRQVARDRDHTIVQYYMRFIQSVPRSLGHMLSSYPSEPILAGAAAQQMHT